MSTSILYHGFGIRGYHHVRTAYQEGRVVFYVKEAKLRCAVCGSYHVGRRGSNDPREIRSLPIGMHPTKVVIEPARVKCLDCGALRQVEITFTEGERGYTRAMERYVVELCRMMSIKHVSRHTGLHWATVKEIHKRHLKRQFGRPRLKDLTTLAIDEICIGRHRFVTVVLDQMTGAVVYVDKGKSGASLKTFWKRLKLSGARVHAVAVDMSPAYTRAVRDNLPDATLVYDRFHVVKLMNKKITALRRSIQRKASGEAKEVLKGSRWLLLKNPENLVEEKGEDAHLQRVLALNEPLATAYYLKEDLRAFWEQESKEAGEKYITGWLARAKASGIRIMKAFAKTMEQHLKGLLAYYDYFISTGPLEGFNNKIKTMQRQSYGLRDHEYFELKVYSLHTTTYRLVGQL